MVASTVQWITPDPCLVLSESDSILYADFKYCEENNHRHSKRTYWSTKPSNLGWQKSNSKKNLHILGDGASGVQVSDIEQVVV